MGEVTLVDTNLEEGHRLVERLNQEGVVVVAAAWVKEIESGDWYLYLATPLVTKRRGKLAAYHRVNEVIRVLEEEGFAMDPQAKKVVGLYDPMVKDMIAQRDKRPGGRPVYFRGARLGDVTVEEAYIYPPPAKAD